MDFPGKNTGVGCHFLLQGIFLTQNGTHSLLGRWILYHWATWEVALCFDQLSFPTHNLPEDSSWLVCANVFFQKGFQLRGLSEALASLILGWCPLHFDPQGVFLHMYSGSLAPTMENMWPLILLLKQGLVPLCSVITIILKCPEEVETSFALFLLLFPSWSTNKWLVVNA